MKKRIYLFASGTLQRQDNSLVYVTKKGKEYIPIYQIETIFVFGSCNLNKAVLQILNEYTISLLFFSYYGHYIGSYLPKQNYIGKIHQLQFELFQQPESLFLYQKEIIATSVHNMISVLKYYQKKRCTSIYQIIELEQLDEEIRSLEIEEQRKLLILEARSKQVYYSSFNHIIKNKDFVFTKRSTFPPKDAVNAVMSYGYALLYGIVETSLYCSQLLPQLGIIHGHSKANNSLKYDIADIFKPVLVDRLIFRLINKGQLTHQYFTKKNESVYLNKEGCSLFIEAFEETLKNTIIISNRKWSYRSIIKREIHHIELSLQKKIKYRGYRMGW